MATVFFGEAVSVRYRKTQVGLLIGFTGRRHCCMLRHTSAVKTVKYVVELFHQLVSLRHHSHRARRRASTILHTSNERCQFKLGYT